MTNKLFSLILLSLFLIGIVSANIEIIGDSNINVDKLAQEIKFVPIKIKNTGNFSLYNISIQNNPYVSMQKISELSQQAEANFNLTIKSTSNFNGQIPIKGYYISNLGKNYETFEVNVSNGLISQCNFNIVEGDTVKWNNKDFDDLILMDSNTESQISVIQKDSSYSKTFPPSTTLNYRFDWIIGDHYTDECSINSLSATGYINDPLQDGKINLNVNINYPSTNIELTLLETFYTIEIGNSLQDILKIKNIGNEIAKNIAFSSDWISFSTNNFDLNPGESKNIGYTISPIISNSNKTNKTYTKQISINGNFNVSEKSITIFIPYSSHISQDQKNKTGLDDLVNIYSEILKAYCNEEINKNTEVCIELKETSLGFFKQNNSEDSKLDQLIGKFGNFIKENSKEGNSEKNFQVELVASSNRTETKVNENAKEIGTIKEEIDEIKEYIMFVVILICFLIISSIVIILIFKYKSSKKQGDYEHLK